jgi:nucleotide-binding universal stress UspA family protein
MAIRDILVHLDAAPASAARLELAATLARRHDARLTGLVVIDIVLPPIATPDGGGAALGPLLDAMRRDALVEAEGIRTRFEDTLSRIGVQGEWRMAEGLSAELVARHGAAVAEGSIEEVVALDRSLHLESCADRLTGDPGAVLLRDVPDQSGIVTWMTARLKAP